MYLRSWGCVLLFVAAAIACGEGDQAPAPLLPPIAGGAGDADAVPTAGGGAAAGDASLAGTPMGVPVLPDVGGAGGTSTAPELGGAGGDGGHAETPFPLPAECPGSASDYTTIISGTEANDVFTEDDLLGRALILGGGGDDVFPASPAGAGDCLLGGEGNDRFETRFQGAPSVFVGGPGDDIFALRGSQDSDAPLISDFKGSGADRIVLDAMAYGLSPAPDSNSVDPAQIAIVSGFEGGNSTAVSGVRILYNPDDGGIWFDSDEDGADAEAVRIGVIQNFSSYTFAIGDWVLE